MKVQFKTDAAQASYIYFLVGLTGKTVNKFAEHAFIEALAKIEKDWMELRKKELEKRGETDGHSGEAQVSETSDSVLSEGGETSHVSSEQGNSEGAGGKEG